MDSGAQRRLGTVRSRARPVRHTWGPRPRCGRAGRSQTSGRIGGRVLHSGAQTPREAVGVPRGSVPAWPRILQETRQPPLYLMLGCAWGGLRTPLKPAVLSFSSPVTCWDEGCPPTDGMSHPLSGPWAAESGRGRHSRPRACEAVRGAFTLGLQGDIQPATLARRDPLTAIRYAKEGS